MSFLLTVAQTGVTVQKCGIGQHVTVTGDEKQGTVLKGFVFENKAQELFNSGWEDDPSRIQNYDGVMILVHYDPKRVVICSDMMASCKCYYYHGDQKLLVSDDFWQIVKALRPGIEDIDIPTAKNTLLLGGSVLCGSTIIKGMHIILPATRIVYDRETNELKSEDYAFFHSTGQITDIDTAVEMLDAAFDRTMKEIKRIHGDVVYGIGLSGGLDSRVVLHYAKKNGMRVACFNMCKRKPNGLLEGRGLHLARQLAKVYDVPLTVLEWDPDQVDDIKQIMIRRYPDGAMPEGATDIFKFNTNWKEALGIDVLLTGGKGAAMQLFSPFLGEFSNMTDDELLAYFIGMLFNTSTVLSVRINNALHTLFGTPVRTHEQTYRYAWEKELFSDQKPELVERIRGILRQCRAAGLSSLECCFHLRSKYISTLCCNGAFESLFDYVPNYSIYSSYVLKVGLQTDPELLAERGFLRELIRQKLNEAGNVAEEDNLPAPGKIDRFAAARRMLAVADRILRGDSAHQARRYWRAPQVLRAFADDMTSDTV